jgi:hypothetical protein
VVAVEQWAEVRRLHFVRGLSIQEIHRRTGLHRDTMRRALAGDVADPQAWGAVERLQGFLETNFEPGRAFANELDFGEQLDGWIAKANAGTHKTLRARPVDRLAQDLRPNRVREPSARPQHRKRDHWLFFPHNRPTAYARPLRRPAGRTEAPVAGARILGAAETPQRTTARVVRTDSSVTLKRMAPMEVKGHTGTVRFDGQVIEIVRKGLLARAIVGKGTKQIPLASITAVQFKPAGPFVNGFIQFTVSGGNEGRSSFGRQTTDAAKDENAVVFHYKQRARFEELRDAVQAALSQRHQSDGGAWGIPDRIKQLAELKDAGVLTEAEFEAKKVDLLDRL